MIIKTPSLSSIEKPFVETFNKVGNAIDNAVKKGSEVFTKKSFTAPGKNWGLDKLNWDKVFKEGKGLAMGSVDDVAAKWVSRFILGPVSAAIMMAEPVSAPTISNDQELMDYHLRNNPYFKFNEGESTNIDDLKTAINDAAKSIQQIDTSNWQYVGKVQLDVS